MHGASTNTNHGYKARQSPAILLTALFLLLVSGVLRAQTRPQDSPGYRMRVSANEVDLTFHAAGADGEPIGDLERAELQVFDNERGPGEIVAFDVLRDLPIRVGILLDTSASMNDLRARDRAIVLEYLKQWFRSSDQAFVMDFARATEMEQSWSGNFSTLSSAVRQAPRYGGMNVKGTALYDAVYRACLSQFKADAAAGSGNFLLVFSDGEDNASQTSLREAVDMCQHRNTAVYALRLEKAAGLFAHGPGVLMQLCSETGGRVFDEDASDQQIASDLRTMDADQRSRYHVIYRPAGLKHDGGFHRLVLLGPSRVRAFAVRSGYYDSGK